MVSFDIAKLLHRSHAPALIVMHTLQVTRHTRREAGIQCQGLS